MRVLFLLLVLAESALPQQDTMGTVDYDEGGFGNNRRQQQQPQSRNEIHQTLLSVDP
jgi:hypothetical protein